MGETRQINIKNRTYYFYNYQINLKDFDASLSKFEKKITKRLTFITLVCYKYLVLDDETENKEVSQKYEEVWNGI